jgi:hypothetical protein
VWEDVIKPLLNWESALILLGISGLLLIPYVGEVVLLALMGAAIYDLFTRVAGLFRQYYETALAATSYEQLREAAGYFSSAVIGGLLDILGIIAGGAALTRLRVLRSQGKLTVGAWLEAVAQWGQQLWARLRSGGRLLERLWEQARNRTSQGAAAVARMARYRTRPPFRRNPNHSQAEYERQIRLQQEGLNEMTVEEYLQNSDRYRQQGRAPEGNQAQEAARRAAREDKVDELIRAGRTPQQAETEADAWLRTQNALHNPDQIAGGHADQIGGMGDAGVNKSIGSQWEKRGIAQSMDEHIRREAARMTPAQRRTTRLNVELDH